MKRFIAREEKCEKEQRKLVCELPADESGDSNQVSYHSNQLP